MKAVKTPRLAAFLRAINVGGHVVKMDELRRLFEALGFSRVETFIASGNVIFDSSSKNSAALEKKIATTLHQSLGYEVATFIRTTDELIAIAQHQPFPKSEIEAPLSISAHFCTIKRKSPQLFNKKSKCYENHPTVFYNHRTHFLGSPRPSTNHANIARRCH